MMLIYYPGDEHIEVVLLKNIIYVESHTYVTANKYSVIFRNVISKEVKYIPFTDIEYVIFDHQNSYFSTKFIIACKHFDIGVLFCDEKHAPTSVLYSEYNYHLKWKRLINLAVI